MKKKKAASKTGFFMCFQSMEPKHHIENENACLEKERLEENCPECAMVVREVG